MSTTVGLGSMFSEHGTAQPGAILMLANEGDWAKILNLVRASETTKKIEGTGRIGCLVFPDICHRVFLCISDSRLEGGWHILTAARVLIFEVVFGFPQIIRQHETTRTTTSSAAGALVIVDCRGVPDVPLTASTVGFHKVVVPDRSSVTNLTMLNEIQAAITVIASPAPVEFEDLSFVAAACRHEGDLLAQIQRSAPCREMQELLDNLAAQKNSSGKIIILDDGPYIMKQLNVQSIFKVGLQRQVGSCEDEMELKDVTDEMACFSKYLKRQLYLKSVALHVRAALDLMHWNA